MELDAEDLFLHTNLAPALLLQGKTAAAVQEYEYWKDKPFGQSDLRLYRDAFLADLKGFEKVGVVPEARRGDVAAVRKLLGE